MPDSPQRWVADPETGCWIWTGCLDNGYGVLFRSCEKVYAHRWVWEQEREEIPEGMHLVRNWACPRNCVNPDHGQLQTQAEKCRYISRLGRPPAVEAALAAKARALASIRP